MTQFEMPLGDSAKRFASLDSFTQGYIEAMYFTECNIDDKELEDCTLDDLSDEAWASIEADCNDFREFREADLDEACDNGRINGYDIQRAGNDFWYTRNGHGTGFWDRDLGDVGDKLARAAKVYGSSNLYKGDDGKLYVD